jgi:hypothetical protein
MGEGGFVVVARQVNLPTLDPAGPGGGVPQPASQPRSEFTMGRDILCVCVCVCVRARVRAAVCY